MYYKWTDEMKDYLKEIVVGRNTYEITKMINEKFNLELQQSQIQGMKSRMKLRSGVDCKFKKGMTPHNKGKKGVIPKNFNWEKCFPKGHVPVHTRDLWDEKLDKDGYVEIKVSENPPIWQKKNRYLYEQYHNVKLKDTDVIIFADKDITNFSKDNLVLVTRAELLVLNNRQMIYDDAELTKTSVNVAKLIIKNAEVKKKKQMDRRRKRNDNSICQARYTT